MSQLHLVSDPPIRKGLGRAGLRRKVPGTKHLFKQKYFLIPKIQRLTLSSYKQQIPNSQRVIQTTSMERNNQ